MIFASISLVIATSALALSTWFLSRSSRRHEKLTQTQIGSVEAQTKAIEAQTKTLVAPRMAFDWPLKRIDVRTAEIRLSNKGLGTAHASVKVSYDGTTIRLPPEPGILILAPGDMQVLQVDVPSEINKADIEITYMDVLNNKYVSLSKATEILPVAQ